ncbi:MULTISPECIES: hypothetical protein [unclassified Chitinophaga]|uniref:hypothetical protein n=1 Tax=unclassified Chitinophaga TaxID=2619133 RepID=UPI00300FBD5E
MAYFTNGITFVGAIGNMTAYKMRGSDKVIIRGKGGASKEQIRHSPRFERTRENNAEFGGCSYASKAIRHTLFPVKHLADYNFTPTMNKLAKSIQLLDKVGERGKRDIQLSRHGYLLDGFQLNKKTPFDSVLRRPISCSIERETGSAVIQLPYLKPGSNLMMPWQYPFFRIIITFGMVADVVYNENGYQNREELPVPTTVYTEWQPVKQDFKAQNIALQLTDLEGLDDTKMLLVGIGIEIGMPITNEVIDVVKYAGCAKILATG